MYSSNRGRYGRPVKYERIGAYKCISGLFLHVSAAAYYWYPKNTIGAPSNPIHYARIIILRRRIIRKIYIKTYVFGACSLIEFSYRPVRHNMALKPDKNGFPTTTWRHYRAPTRRSRYIRYLIYKIPTANLFFVYGVEFEIDGTCIFFFFSNAYRKKKI